MFNAENVHNIIKNVKALSGNAKIEYLKSLNEFVLDEFRTLAVFVLEPTSSYHVTTLDEMPVNVLFETATKTTDLHDFFKFISLLHVKGSADGADKAHLNNLYTYACPDGRALMQMVLDRNMRCGVSAKSLRKVFGKDFVPDFPVMLCSSYDKKKIEKNIHFPAISQLKSDGSRCEAIISYESCKLHSRNGKVYQGLDSLETILESYCDKGVKLVVDGELVVLDADGNVLDRKTGNGILNKSIKGTITPAEAARVKFIVWDIINYHEFKGGNVSIPYAGRLDCVNYLVSRCNNPDKIAAQKSRVVDNLAEAAEHYREEILNGEEGTILKDRNAYWKDGRSNSQIKFKEVFLCEVKITGWYYGKKGSKYEHCIGGLTYETSDGLVKGNVGSGLTDKDRGVGSKNIEEHAKLFVDSIASLEYNARINRVGETTQTFFLPRFVDIREDKDVADSLDDLIAMEDAARQIGELK